MDSMFVEVKLGKPRKGTALLVVCYSYINVFLSFCSVEFAGT